MNDFKTSRDRLPRNNDKVGVAFSLFLVAAAGIVAGSLAAIVLHLSGLTDAFVTSFQ